jgi:trigger factor
MRITETNVQGLKREYTFAVAADEIEKRLHEKLTSLGRHVRLPGFRPGKAPEALLRKQYGKALLGEILEETVTAAVEQVVRENALRPALKPKVEVTKFAEGAALEGKFAIEIMPEIKLGDFRELAFEKLVADVTAEDVEEALRGLADRHKNFVPVAKARPARKGDVLRVDFLGRIEGKIIKGGEGKDRLLELGTGALFPEFDEKLVGASAGQRLEIDVNFPAEHPLPELAGKTATFTVEITEVCEPQPVGIDDALAKTFGLATLEALKDTLKTELEQSHARVSRQLLKRALLDRLAADYTFAVPEGMVAMEFQQIWRELESHPGGVAAAMEAESKSEDQLKTDYRAIAERRVRLGLVLAEVGRLNRIEVTPDEINRAIIGEVRRYPGQERQMLEFFQKNPEAAARFRAPIFEDKAVDFILEMAESREKRVSRAELRRIAGGVLGPQAPVQERGQQDQG